MVGGLGRAVNPKVGIAFFVKGVVHVETDGAKFTIVECVVLVKVRLVTQCQSVVTIDNRLPKLVRNRSAIFNGADEALKLGEAGSAQIVEDIVFFERVKKGDQIIFR
jgi:hypothetical protein